jgi:hypothetical protein
MTDPKKQEFTGEDTMVPNEAVDNAVFITPEIRKKLKLVPQQAFYMKKALLIGDVPSYEFYDADGKKVEAEPHAFVVIQRILADEQELRSRIEATLN